MVDVCEICLHNVCGRGSETCDAVIGDFCPLMDNYIIPTPKEWESYDKKTKTFYKELFAKVGIDIPYCV